MTTVRDLIDGANQDHKEGLVGAIDAFNPNSTFLDREIQRERFPLDALVFASWQTPYTTLEMYRALRCKYDEETNLWLENYVKEMAAKPDDIPPVLLDITRRGVALVDGFHRTSALLMLTDRIRIDAWVVS